MENVLEELKGLSIAKIKVAYNRSVDVEAIHSVLWNRSDKISKIQIFITVTLSLITVISLVISIFLGFISEFGIYLSILIISIVILVIWEGFKRFSDNHGHIVNEALQLREVSTNFLQYKLDNLDKQGYIEELKTLEKKDKNLKEKSAKHTHTLSTKTKNLVEDKIDFLEKQGIKKYFMTQEEIDSATEKLQRYTALRTCEAWIKFT